MVIDREAVRLKAEVLDATLRVVDDPSWGYRRASPMLHALAAIVVVGMAMLDAIFLTDPATGWSQPFKWLVCMSPWFALLAGNVWILRRELVRRRLERRLALAKQRLAAHRETPLTELP